MVLVMKHLKPRSPKCIECGERALVEIPERPLTPIEGENYRWYRCTKCGYQAQRLPEPLSFKTEVRRFLQKNGGWIFGAIGALLGLTKH